MQDDALNTPLGPIGRYADQYPKLKKIFDTLFKAKDKTNYEILEVKAEIKELHNDHKKISILYQDTKVIPLSIIRFCPEKGNQSVCLVINHTNITQINDVLNLANVIFQDALSWNKQEKSIRKLYFNLGMLSWYLAHATPCVRGSAATTETLIRAILKYHKQPLSPFRQGITWDLKALFTPKATDFANDYVNLFNHLDLSEKKSIKPKGKSTLVKLISFFIVIGGFYILKNQPALRNPVAVGTTVSGLLCYFFKRRRQTDIQQSSPTVVFK